MLLHTIILYMYTCINLFFGVEHVQLDDPAYQVFASLWEEKHHIPRIHQYRSRSKKEASLPSLDDLNQLYGSYNQALFEFLDLYHSIHGYIPLHDYLLGALVNRAKVVHTNRGRWFLRITSKDEAQFNTLSKFITFSVTNAQKRKPTKYLRCYDDDVIIAYDHLCKDGPPFRESADFVRGYIDTHSHFRSTSATSHRLTITGSLVPQVHDFLVRLGATNTKVYIEHPNKQYLSYRMNVHAKSLRKIREVLYPMDCVCNEEVRKKMYQV